MTAQPTHTPTPWKLEYDEIICNSDRFPITLHSSVNDGASVNIEIAKANAAFIVRAVNAHEELLNGLKDALSFIRDDRQCLSKRCGHYEKSDCIDTFIADKIAKAEEK